MGRQRLRHQARRRRHRRDHELHEHEQPLRDDRRRPAGQESRRKGPDGPAVREDQPRPGSRVVTDYFEKAGLDTYLDKLGFHTVGYGCTTCIGNSGPLPEPVAEAVKKDDLVVAGVLSGNRNFEGRINPT